MALRRTWFKVHYVIGCGLRCSTDIHSIHSGLLRRPEFFFCTMPSRWIPNCNKDIPVKRKISIYLLNLKGLLLRETCACQLIYPHPCKMFAPLKENIILWSSSHVRCMITSELVPSQRWSNIMFHVGARLKISRDHSKKMCHTHKCNGDPY